MHIGRTTGPALERIRDFEEVIYAELPARPDPDRQVASAPGRGTTRG